MLARLSAFVIWALVAAAVTFWALRLLVRAPAAPAYAVAVADAGAVRGDLRRLLGAAPVNAPAAPVAGPEASSRFKLLGIVAPKAQGDVPSTGAGVALIAIDGKMPKAYAVGAALDSDLVLQSVSLRTVSIASGRGAPPITLELPPLVAAATGTLPITTDGTMPQLLTPRSPPPMGAPMVEAAPPRFDANSPPAVSAAPQMAR